MKIMPCAEWDARPINNLVLPRTHAQGIVIHHTATPNVRPVWPATLEVWRCRRLARAIQRDHIQGNGWRDSGHHFLVTRSGHVLEGRNGSFLAAQRGVVIQGAHAGDANVNKDHWGIEMEGTYTSKLPSSRQLAALVDLCAHLCLWGDVQSAQIYGHRKYRPTECPGERLFDYLPILQWRVHERKAQLMGDNR